MFGEQTPVAGVLKATAAGIVGGKGKGKGRSPRDEIGRAFSHAPASFDEAASSRARDIITLYFLLYLVYYFISCFMVEMVVYSSSLCT